jgi:mannose-6-phosphate isomerase class I
MECMACFYIADCMQCIACLYVTDCMQCMACFYVTDCMECMACSDNVVRAGLTPKFKDVQTLCDILEYKYQSVAEMLFASVADPVDQFTAVYDPPVSEFTIAKTQVIN